MLAAIVALTIVGSGSGALVSSGPNEIYGSSPCEVQVAVKGSKGQVLYYTCKN